MNEASSWIPTDRGDGEGGMSLCANSDENELLFEILQKVTNSFYILSLFSMYVISKLLSFFLFQLFFLFE